MWHGALGVSTWSDIWGLEIRCSPASTIGLIPFEMNYASVWHLKWLLCDPADDAEEPLVTSIEKITEPKFLAVLLERVVIRA
jgi:hypothetical protein